jgi:hypothetical protein
MFRREYYTVDNISYLQPTTQRQRKIRSLILKWTDYDEFKTGIWDTTTKDSTYKVRSHPGFTGRIIPNGLPENPFVRQGQKIWQTFQEEPIQAGEFYRDYFQVIETQKIGKK